MKEDVFIPDHGPSPVFAPESATREQIRQEMVDELADAILKLPLTKSQTEIAKAILRAAIRTIQNPPKASDGDGTSSAKGGSGTNQNEASQ